MTPLVPSTSGSGGKRAVYNHLLDLPSSVHVDLVAVDVEGVGESVPILNNSVTVKIFQRALPKVTKSLISKLKAAFSLFTSPLPRALAVVTSPSAKSFILDRLATYKYDFVVVDHLNAFGLVANIPSLPRLIYIAHNSESLILRQNIGILPRISLKKFFLFIDYLKLVIIENKCCRVAEKILLISDSDAKARPLSDFSEKCVAWPELPVLKSISWKGRGDKSILFVGSAKYFPNRDAIEWLCTDLIPKIRIIDPNISLKIAGTASNQVAESCLIEGVNFLGFVSDAELEALHHESALFISPVVLGSGIKIKVLEASSYGMPIAATRESLCGISYLNDCCILFDRNDPDMPKKLCTALNDSEYLSTISSRSYASLKSEISIKQNLFEVINA